MPQWLALEIDSTEARAALATVRGTRLVIEQAFTVPLGGATVPLTLRVRSAPHAEREEYDNAVASAGEQVAAALASRGIGKIDTLLAVGRTDVELRQIAVPPAPDAEMPALVRMQAVREFNELGSGWLLDFSALSTAEDGSRTVLAAAIGPRAVSDLRQACAPAGLRLRRMILRPCAAVALLEKLQPGDDGQLRLVVDLLADEVDLTVSEQSRALLLRTARLPGDPLAEAEGRTILLAEIRRTLAAAQHQLGGRPIASIVLLGTGKAHEDLVTALRSALHLDVELVDPFAAVSLSAELERSPPTHPGRFAPLLGMLLVEAARGAHAIDFLNPRQPPKPRSVRQTLVLTGVVVGVLLLGWAGWHRLERESIRAEMRSISQQTQALNAKLGASKSAVQRADDVDRWLANDFNWLDKLYLLSERFPPAKEAMLESLSMTQGNRGGLVELHGLAAKAEVLEKASERMRDTKHSPIDKTSAESAANPNYKMSFTTTIEVAGEATGKPAAGRPGAPRPAPPARTPPR